MIDTKIRIIAANVCVELDDDEGIRSGDQIEIVAEILGPEVPFGQTQQRIVVNKYFDAFELFNKEDEYFKKSCF